jgi:hypothetical protein
MKQIRKLYCSRKSLRGVPPSGDSLAPDSEVGVSERLQVGTARGGRSWDPKQVANILKRVRPNCDLIGLAPPSVPPVAGEPDPREGP